MTAADSSVHPRQAAAEAIALDLNADFAQTLGRRRYDCVLALDVLEHLKRPEEGVRAIAEILKPQRNRSTRAPATSPSTSCG